MLTFSCQLYGNEFETASNQAKYCPDCRKKQEIPPKIACQRKLQQIILCMYREKLKSYAESHGLSVNKLFLTALQEYRTNHKEDNSNG